MVEFNEKFNDKPRDRATSLYTFLKEFTQLRSKTVRNVDGYEEVLWFSDIPEEPECECVVWDFRDDGKEPSETWLSVCQPKLALAPEPSEKLKPWLFQEQIGDSSLEKPLLRGEILNSKADEYGNEQLEHLSLLNQPEVRELWTRYVERQWLPWAGSDRRNQTVQDIYTQLFSIYQKQQRLGEQYEVVLGMGLLAWRTSDKQEIKRHLIVANINITFDNTRGIISVGPAGEGAKVQIEHDMIDPSYQPGPEKLKEFDQILEELGEQYWNAGLIDSILAGWVHAASPRGKYDQSLVPSERIASDPIVSFAPALVLRKRTERSYLKAFSEIIEQLAAGAPVPAGVARFVAAADYSEVSHDPTAPTEELRGSDSPQELYFPLERNDAQIQIIERLSNHQGVLVQGPPGTGKSHTIVNLICHLLANGQRVLVTSHTARALKVIQKFIHNRVPEISPLAVVLLGDDREALQAMENSVQGITTRQNHWDLQDNQKKILDLEMQLDNARRQEAETLAELRAIRESETYEHSLPFGAYQGTLQKIAIRIRQKEYKYGWLKERPGKEQDLTITAKDLTELLLLMRDNSLDEWESSGFQALDSEILQSAHVIAKLFERETEAQAECDKCPENSDDHNYSVLFDADQKARRDLLEKNGELLAVVDRIKSHFHVWADQAVREIMGDYDREWRDLFETTQSQLAVISKHARKADGTHVTGLGDRDKHEVLADAKELLKHFDNGAGWGVWPFRPAVARRCLYLRQEVKVNGEAAKGKEQLELLIIRMGVETRLKAMRERWASVQEIDARKALSAQVREIEDFCEPLEDALSLHERISKLRELIIDIPGLLEPVWHKSESIKVLYDCLQAVESQHKLRSIKAEIKSQYESIESLYFKGDMDPIGGDLIHAIRTRNIEAYKIVLTQASKNKRKSEKLLQRRNLLALVRSQLPESTVNILNSYSDESWDQKVENLPAAWDWARATAWLESLSDPNREKGLIQQLDSTRNRIMNRLKDIAAAKAWEHCFKRMTDHERQHLVAWSKAVRSIGKGTGKYAPMHRRNARKHMNECRSAIPAWVMPIYRVAETINPGTDLFDVVIVDEASQSGPEAMLLAYLTKKLIVVGDDKQISPTYAGINFEDVNQLRDRHLSDVPHADSYGVSHSFFDLAEIRYQGRIRLREHFRCMPEIIQFSNNLCYSNEPLIPMRQYGSSRLTPVVSTRHVPDGYMKGKGPKRTNPPEAEAIVREILRINSNKKYIGKTFGVISLLGNAQAREIEMRLVEELGPKDMEKRELVCGDAYAFQGDERDIMFLSMVSAPSDTQRIGTLTIESARQRFNVAASRARDQMILFHTATINDLSPKGFRHALLKYCQHPMVESLDAEQLPIAELRQQAEEADRMLVQPPEPFESWFELDVFLRIVSRGHRVLPQYEVAGYRIDLVIDGMDYRIAVECDGDHWHGPEQYDADMARQRDLERCGWKFFRVRGSAFSLDPEGAMESLWKIIEREQKHQISKQKEQEATADISDDELLSAVEIVSDTTEVEDKVEPAIPVNEMEGVPEEEPIAAGIPENEMEETISQAALDFAQAHANDEDFDETIEGTDKPKGLHERLLDDPEEIETIVHDIVEANGPMCVERLCRLFILETGFHGEGRKMRSHLNKSIYKAIENGLLEKHDETGNEGMEEWIVHIHGTPRVVVRDRGSREFLEIPPSEIATVMNTLNEQFIFQDEDELFRAVLSYFDTKLMLPKTSERLRFVYENRESLAERNDS